MLKRLVRYIRTMNRTLAIAFSYIVHPALMPMIGVALSLLLTPHYISGAIFWLVMLHVFLGTYILPLLLALALKRMGLLSSLTMANPGERWLPYITAGLFYFITAHSLREYPIPLPVTAYLLSGVAILAVALALLPFIKLSIHTAGLGALTSLGIYLSIYYAVDMLPFIALSVLLSGLVATARLYLNAHTPAEVYLGFLLGISSVFGVFSFMI